MWIFKSQSGASEMAKTIRTEKKSKKRNRSAVVKMTPECYVLKKLRAEKGLSMTQVGKLMDCSDSYISFLENGRTEIPQNEFFDKLLKLYGLSRNAFNERCRRYEAEETDVEFIVKNLERLKPDQVFFIRSLVNQYLQMPPQLKS